MLAQSGLRVSSYEAHRQMAPHQHDEATMNVIVAGGFRERIGNGERNYTRGTVAFCPAGMTHSQSFGPVDTRQIIFSPKQDWLDFLADCKSTLDDSPHTCSMKFCDLGDRLLAEMHHNDSLSAVAREGIVLEIIAAFGRRDFAAAADARPPAWLLRARDFLHENAFSRVSMAQIAREAGRHEIHLAREFRRFLGVTVGTYLRRLRSEEAARLLLTSQKPISEIAQCCSFANHAHLCRQFKAHFGVTPSEYRSRER
jgi:AraC family transcriptional regulator